VSGVTVATAAAMAVGAQVAHRVPAAATPIVSTAENFTGTVSAAAAPASANAQVAQATPVNGRPGRSSANDPILDASAGSSALDDDESLGTTADKRTFESVYDLVQDHYVDTLPNDTKMAHGAIRSMIASLADPNSFFLDPDQRALLDDESKGKYQGIGAVTTIRGIKQPEGYTEYKIFVVDAIPGSAAEKAGLKPGDVITHVDGKWVLGSDPFLKANKLFDKIRDHDPDDEDAFRKEYESARKRVLGGVGLQSAQMQLRKGIGDKHDLTIQRPGVAAPIKVALTTSQIEAEPVSVRRAPDGKATVIKVNLLTDKAPAAVKTALAGIRTRGVVLDLRNNPGGGIVPAQQIEALFAQNRAFAVEIGHNGKKSKLAASSATATPPRPLVVLVDKGTARTAEALAQSLGEAGVATVIGGRTFGDGMAHTLYSLRDGSGFMLTTGKLLSPRGLDWQALGGITPQVALASGASEEEVLAKAESVLEHPTQAVAAAAPAATSHTGAVAGAARP